MMKSSPARRSRFVFIASLIVFALSIANSTQAQEAGDGGDGGDGGTGDGPLFQATEPDLSVFDGIERGDAIGTSATQGFGIAAEAAGGGGGGGGGGGFGGGGLGGLGGLFGGLGGAFGGQGASSAKPVIRVRLRSAIEVPPKPVADVQRSASRTLSGTSASTRVRGVNVMMVGRTAVLSGVVAREKDRRMSELLMRLEPGVDRVENNVVVNQ